MKKILILFFASTVFCMDKYHSFDPYNDPESAPAQANQQSQFGTFGEPPYRLGRESQYNFLKSTNSLPPAKKQSELCSKNLLLAGLSSCCGLVLLTTLVVTQVYSGNFSGHHNVTKTD